MKVKIENLGPDNGAGRRQVFSKTVEEIPAETFEELNKYVRARWQNERVIFLKNPRRNKITVEYNGSQTVFSVAQHDH